MAVIALYDSGIGGIPVLSALVRALPDETFLFYGDNLNMPYGNKTREELCSIASVNLDYLSGFAPDVLLFACNTLSTALPKGALSRCAFPVVGLKPPFPPEKPAESDTRKPKNTRIFSVDKEDKGAINAQILSAERKIFPAESEMPTKSMGRLSAENAEENDLSDCLLLSTSLTAKTPYVERARRRGLRVVAAEKLAENVERFYYDEDQTRWEKALRPLDLSSVKTLYLGCTHYLWLKPYFRRKYPGLRIEDGVSDAIKRVKIALKKHGALLTPVKIDEKTDEKENIGVLDSLVTQRNVAGTGESAKNRAAVVKNCSKNQISGAGQSSRSANEFLTAAPGAKGGIYPKEGNGSGFSYTAKAAVGTTVHFVGECSVQNQNAYLFFNKQTF